MPKLLKPHAGRGIKSFFGGKATDENWAEERAYWHGVLSDYYQSEFRLSLDAAQSDASLIPPRDVVVKIQNTDKSDPDAFFATGYRTALSYLHELRDYGARVDQMSNILEMGVGMGRLMIHYFPFQAKLFGCDVTPDAAAWTRSKLAPRVDVATTGLEPPLPYADGMFDFVYANSVFTHVPCPLIDAWARELRRIVRPGGMLIFSVLDANHYLRNIPPREFHRRFEVAGCCDWDRDRGVMMLTYLTRDYIHNTWGQYFDVLELRSHYYDQTHVICRRPAA